MKSVALSRQTANPPYSTTRYDQRYAAAWMPYSLAVANHDPGMRHQTFDPLLSLLDRLHAVVDVEDLPPALQLPLDDLLDQVVIVGGDKGLDRQPLLRGRLDNR